VKLYSELPGWWSLFSNLADYQEEASLEGDRLLETDGVKVPTG